MANRKRRCSQCKSYKIAEDGIVIHNTFFCDISCATTKAYKGIEKGKKIVHREQKRNYQLSDLKIRKAAAITACHAYIKARDMGCNCITCDRPLVGKYDSGHFIKAGNHPYTRFMEKNIHSQCVNCNQYNGGREKEYKEVLINKYSHITVRALEKLRNKKLVRTAQDYLAIEKHYKLKIKKYPIYQVG